MAKKDRVRAKATGVVHRDGQQVQRDQPRVMPAECDVPHCGSKQRVPQINNLPLCEEHAERFLTQFYFHDKIMAAIAASKGKPGQTKGGLYLPTGSNQERQALRNLAQGFNPRRR